MARSTTSICVVFLSVMALNQVALKAAFTTIYICSVSESATELITLRPTLPSIVYVTTTTTSVDSITNIDSITSIDSTTSVDSTTCRCHSETGVVNGVIGGAIIGFVLTAVITAMVATVIAKQHQKGTICHRSRYNVCSRHGSYNI